MIINSVNLNNNFGAKIVGKLKKEMNNKQLTAYLSSSTKHLSLDPEKVLLFPIPKEKD